MLYRSKPYILLVYELEAVLIFAAVALTVSLFTAYGVTFIRKRWAQEVSPMLEQVNEMLESKPLEQLNASMSWIKNYASTAPSVMLDHVEGMVNERMEVFGAHMESVIADTKVEVLEFANVYGQQAMAAGAKLLQGRGASLLGKEGREKSLANAQIKRAKDEMTKMAIESQLPDGITIEMAESVAERFGYELSDVQQFLPMIMKAFPNALGSPRGGAGPVNVQSPPPNIQTKSLWG